MKKEEEGVVIALLGDVAKVRASRHSDCDNCGTCPGDSAAVMDVYNPVKAAVGQRVVFEMHEAHMVKAAFVVFLMPLLAGFGGFLLGMWFAGRYGWPGLLSEICGCLLAFGLSLAYVRRFDRTMANTKQLPIIKNIIS